MSILRQLLVIAALAAAGYALWNADELGLLDRAGRDGPADSGVEARLTPEADGVPVTVAAIGLARDDVRLEAVGDGLALKAVTLFPAVSGEVEALLFEAGQTVAAGETVVRLDDRRERVALDLAEVAVADAERTLARFERAVGSGAVSETEVDAARTALERARLERDQAQIALDDRTVEAPFDGVLGIPRIEIGDRVDDETALATLDDRSVLLVDFEVPEAVAGRIAPGDPVEARTWSLPDARFTGRISALESRIDAATRTIRVRARLPNADDRLRPGMSFAIALDLPGRPYPAVPEVSLQWGREGAYLWRVRDGRAEKLFVAVKKRGAGRILVDGPLAEGDEIVVEGVQRMREGVRVAIVGRAGSPAAGSEASQ